MKFLNFLRALLGVLTHLSGVCTFPTPLAFLSQSLLDLRSLIFVCTTELFIEKFPRSSSSPWYTGRYQQIPLRNETPSVSETQHSVWFNMRRDHIWGFMTFDQRTDMDKAQAYPSDPYYDSV